MDKPSIELSSRAYSKMILHAAKYPHCAVNGVLIASKRRVKNISSNAAENNSNKMLVITDAVPLFHQNLGLTPMTEVALAQVDSTAALNGRNIVGFYHANEHFEDVSVDTFSQRIADKIASASSDEASVLVTLDNRRLGVMMSHPAILVSVAEKKNGGGSWKRVEDNSEQFSLEEGAVEAIAAMIQKGLPEQLVDFDNHLDDVAKDYLNVELNMEIDQCL